MRVILDANMLIIYSLGKVDRDQLGTHKRAQAYMPEDFDLLMDLIADYESILITPNAVTECSNLFFDDSDCGAKEALQDLLHLPITDIKECYIPSSQASDRDQYSFLGISDCAMLELVDENTVLLTADSKLAVEAQKINYKSINFNHYRNFNS